MFYLISYILIIKVNIINITTNTHNKSNTIGLQYVLNKAINPNNIIAINDKLAIIIKINCNIFLLLLFIFIVFCNKPYKPTYNKYCK